MSKKITNGIFGFTDKTFTLKNLFYILDTVHAGIHPEILDVLLDNVDEKIGLFQFIRIASVTWQSCLDMLKSYSLKHKLLDEETFDNLFESPEKTEHIDLSDNPPVSQISQVDNQSKESEEYKYFTGWFYSSAFKFPLNDPDLSNIRTEREICHTH
jgi:hypothetical protein